MPQLRIALAQLNCTVGDLDANRDAALEACASAAAMDADLVVFPEMFLTGYPVEDLALRPSFISASRARLKLLAEQLQLAGLSHLYVVIGHLDAAPASFEPQMGRPQGSPQNVVSVLHAGSIAGHYAKQHLPNYGVFDEYRYFVPGSGRAVFEAGGLRVGIAICEDLWQGEDLMTAYRGDGIDVLLVPNGSPFELDKDDTRRTLVRTRAAQAGCPIVYVNMVGGQDELVFDGGSFIAHPDGAVSMQLPQFSEEIAVAEVGGGAAARMTTEDAADEQQVWQALVLGIRDYVGKNGASSVLLGLSGGIDSAVVAALACDALGAANVHGVSMPSEYSSQHSKDDAADLAERTGLHLRTVPIAPMSALYTATLGLAGLAAENVQARVRGTTLMALSNAEGHLVLATGNKSELAVGYSTVYGDTVGAYAPLKDVFKTMVWRLARWRNTHAASAGQTPPIPESSISKPPSAELRPDQLDTDSLPDYDILDAIVQPYVELDLGAAELIDAGHDAATVMRVLAMVDAAEWKRRQYPPGPKVSPRAFGRDRRLPITSAWREHRGPSIG